MTEWVLDRLILFLAFAAAGAGTHYKSLAEQHRKPGQHGADHPRFWPSRSEFFTPKAVLPEARSRASGCGVRDRRRVGLLLSRVLYYRAIA